MKKKLLGLFFGIFLTLLVGNFAFSATMLMDASNGYGQLVMGPNDDGSSSMLNLPFNVNYFGHTYNNFWINNNGNITFNGPTGQYTPTAFPVSSQPMIAPYWGDVDTRGGGTVSVMSPNAQTVAATWNNVGFYSGHNYLTNSFQAVLRDRPDVHDGDFDIEFRYNRLQWTTGDVSGGIGAQAGYDAGDLTNYYTLPYSRTASVVNLANETNVVGGEAGFWSFQVRSGALPGTTSDNPLMPVVVTTGWRFDFNIVINRPVWIDPVIAVGYDYIVDSGPLVTDVFLPVLGDNLYDLWLWDTATAGWLDSSIDITGGSFYHFASALGRFRIMGIEVGLGLNPLDTTAFVTGLMFDGNGRVSMRQVPVTVDTGNNVVPEPGTMVLFGIGLLTSCFIQRRKNRE